MHPSLSSCSSASQEQAPFLSSEAFGEEEEEEEVASSSSFESSATGSDQRHRREESRSTSWYTAAGIAILVLILLSSLVILQKNAVTSHLKGSLLSVPRKKEEEDDPIIIDDLHEIHDEPKARSSPSDDQQQATTKIQPSFEPTDKEIQSKQQAMTKIYPSFEPTGKINLGSISPYPASSLTVKPAASLGKLTDQLTPPNHFYDAIEEKGGSNNTTGGNTGVQISNAKKKKKQKNNLVLHVGPQKTGSTTLQDAWTGPEGVISKAFADDDHYRYHFIHPNQGYFDCDVGTFGGFQNCTASRKLHGAIATAARAGTNLLLSDENLDEQFAVALRDAIDETQWHVTVIVVYRRIHQWLVSWYNQINKSTNKDAQGHILFDAAGNPYRIKHTHWPDEGGHHVPSFTAWYKEFTRYWQPAELVHQHRSIAFRNAYRPYFNTIVIHNMHHDGDLITNFMCDSVPDARHSCEQLQNQGQPIPRDNMSVILEYDILAVHARENGSIRKTLSRQEVIDAIGKFVERTGTHIPRVCDRSMLDEIKRWLFDSEEAMFDKKLTNDTAHSLDDSFQSYLDKGKLCDIDLEQVFKDKIWLNFFKTLDNRPHLVIHVGPQKTGSTTLQQAWAAPKELGHVLKQDNFLYRYINIHRGTFDCDTNGAVYTNCKASNELKNLFAEAIQGGNHLLISDENLDERFAGALKDAIDDQFRVKVIVTYRPIHQWLLSWYSQINKSTDKDANGNLLKDENGFVTRDVHTHWPSDGGVKVPNFSSWYRNFVHAFDDSNDIVSHHPSVHFMNVYKPLFERVNIYNMNQEGDFVTNFMCQMIPEASKTCDHLKEGVTLPLVNPSVNVEYDILSVEAYEIGLIDQKLTRPTVVSEVTKYVKESNKVLPRRCENEVLDQIHNWLIDSDKLMFPNNWSSDRRVVVGKTFNSYLSSGKLCDIDVDSILNDSEWIQFFASLERSRSLLGKWDRLNSILSSYLQHF